LFNIIVRLENSLQILLSSTDKNCCDLHGVGRSFISVLTFRIRQSGLVRDVCLLQLFVYTGCHLLLVSL